MTDVLQHRLAGISPTSYEHPADRAATAALALIPMLDAVVRKLVEFRYERRHARPRAAGTRPRRRGRPPLSRAVQGDLQGGRRGTRRRDRESREAEWWTSDTRGARCGFENEYGEHLVEFAQLGINVIVLEPGQTSMYHAEENKERHLRPWDFFHAPPWTEHGFVGAGEGPCVIVMTGARSGPGVRYPTSETAARFGASVAEETSD